MIKKISEINKNILNDYRFYLFYGANEGAKSDKIIEILKNIKVENILRYEEKQILENEKNFFDNILSKSLFESEKIIKIDRATDKILIIIEEIISRNINDISIIVNAGSLEKRSKLRTFFEKKKELICAAFYKDTEQTLTKLAYDFLKKKNILISQANINYVASNSSGDRQNLFNQLTKIEYFTKNGNKINTENITKLTNLTEDHNISELVDNCLAKNKKKTLKILNENTFNKEDCILISRVFLNKSKKILNLSKEFELNKNIELTISSAKPPIFWKDKEITKQQIYKWNPKNIKELIYKLNEIELQVKKNIDNSINLITNLILDQFSSISNS